MGRAGADFRADAKTSIFRLQRFFFFTGGEKKERKAAEGWKKVERLDFGGKIRLLNNSSLATGFGRAKYKSFFRSQTLPIKPVLPKAVQLSFHFRKHNYAAPP